MDINKIRDDFPVLKSQNLIYLDSATSTLLPKVVIGVIKEFYGKNGTVSKRGVYKLTVEASDQYQKARIAVADFFKTSSGEISFTPNESFGVSSLLFSLKWRKGDRIVTSLLEHHSNYLPLLYLKNRFGVELDHLAHSALGEIKADSLAELGGPKPKLISLTYSPLLFGTISPIKKIVRIAHEQNIPVLLDGTRIAGHRPIDLKALGVDFFICHGNIGLMGPMGVGLAYRNENYAGDFEPLLIGSGTVSKVTTADYRLMDYPDNFEPGNPNVANALGVKAGIDYLQRIGLSQIRKHEISLVELLLQGLESIDEVDVYGPTDATLKNGIVSFNIEGLNAHDVAMYLDEVADIAVRSGQLCSHPMLNAFSIPGVVQASLHIYNSKEDVNQFVNTVEMIVKELS